MKNLKVLRDPPGYVLRYLKKEANPASERCFFFKFRIIVCLLWCLLELRVNLDINPVTI